MDKKTKTDETKYAVIHQLKETERDVVGYIADVLSKTETSFDTYLQICEDVKNGNVPKDFMQHMLFAGMNFIRDKVQTQAKAMKEMMEKLKEAM